MPLVVYDTDASPAVQSPDPNSYVSIADVRTYWADRADDLIDNASPVTTADSVLTAAILRASDYMKQTFRMRWVGSRANQFAFLDWPRRGVPIPDFFDPYYRDANVPWDFRNTLFFSETAIPAEVKTAQILLTRVALVSATEVQTLNPALERVTKREKLGDLEVEYFGPDGGGQRLRTIYIDALGMLEPYLESDNMGQSLRG